MGAEDPVDRVFLKLKLTFCGPIDTIYIEKTKRSYWYIYMHQDWFICTGYALRIYLRIY